MPFCVLAPRSLQRKGVLFCSRASTSLTEAIGDSSQQAPACLLQRGGDGKGLFQDLGTTRDRDFPCFPWWKEVQRKGTHRGVPLATGRAGEQPLESSTMLVSPDFSPWVKFQLGKDVPGPEDSTHNVVWAEEEASYCERHWFWGKAHKITAWSPSLLG